MKIKYSSGISRLSLTTGGFNTAVGWLSLKQQHFTISRHASPRGGLFFTCNAHHSLKSPLCSCVWITLPASSQTRITASCERLQNFA